MFSDESGRFLTGFLEVDRECDAAFHRELQCIRNQIYHHLSEPAAVYQSQAWNVICGMHFQVHLFAFRFELVHVNDLPQQFQDVSRCFTQLNLRILNLGDVQEVSHL